jgi:hypothetical protein
MELRTKQVHGPGQPLHEEHPVRAERYSKLMDILSKPSDERERKLLEFYKKTKAQLGSKEALDACYEIAFGTHPVHGSHDKE